MSLLSSLSLSGKRGRKGARTFLRHCLPIAVRQLIQRIDLFKTLRYLSTFATRSLWLETAVRGLPNAFLSCMDLQDNLSAW